MKTTIIEKYISTKKIIEDDPTLPTDLKLSLLNKLNDTLSQKLLSLYLGNTIDVPQSDINLIYYKIDLTKEFEEVEIIKKTLFYMLNNDILHKLSLDGKSNILLKTKFNKNQFLEFIIEIFGIDSEYYNAAQKFTAKNAECLFNIVLITYEDLVNIFVHDCQDCIENCFNSTNEKKCKEECTKNNKNCIILEYLQNL